MGDLNFSNLDTTKSFGRLSRAAPARISLDPPRIDELEVPAGAELRFNYAAKAVDRNVVDLLLELGREQQLIEKFRSLATGEVMNPGENRRVLHHLLRGELAGPVVANGVDLGAFYVKQRERCLEFAKRIRSGEIRGSTGKEFRTIVQIGIGGSDLGPKALYLALKNARAEIERREDLSAHFISNVDPDGAADLLSTLNLESALFVLVSKSGTTQETLTNYAIVTEAMRNFPKIDPSRHVVAVTSQSSPLAGSADVLDSFCIDDSIGGRYSSTSSVGGCVLACSLGPDVFREFLAGAHAADQVALDSAPESNAALLDALFGVYERSLLGYPSTAVLPYSQALSRFPAHLQQLDMESNGKRVNRNGEPIGYPTGPVVFGEPGTNGQHSFYQHLHQGTDIVPLQFIGFKDSQLGVDLLAEGHTSQQKLNANLAAQIVAFAQGKADTNPNKSFPGGRPSSLLFGERLTPRNLGALLAHFENKIMFQGFAWNINSFDQEGVQLGKALAGSLLDANAEAALMSFGRKMNVVG